LTKPSHCVDAPLHMVSEDLGATEVILLLSMSGAWCNFEFTVALNTALFLII